jgi:hypothetical protein
MNYEVLKIWIDIAQFGAMFVLSIMIHRGNKRQVEKSEIMELENRLTQIETEARHAPTHDDLGKIYREINSTNKNVQEMSGEFRSAKHTLDLIHQHLLNRGTD